MSHPYESFLREVQRPARYVGGEYGAVVKDAASVDARVALAFPDTYEIGMSHLGLRILYAAVNRHPRLAAERVCAPWPDLEAKLRAEGLPLVSLDSATPLAAFDVIGFSLQFELNYTNVLAMIDLAGLPLRQRDRRETDPLVVAGGPTATHPEPLTPFLDAVVVGDGEEVLLEMLLCDADWRKEGVSRAERLARLAGITGVYVPSLYHTRVDPRTGVEVVDRPSRLGVPLRVDRAFVADLSKHPFPSDGPVPATEAVFERASIEIARGCTEGCRFCQAGMIYRPVRERSPTDVVDAIVASIKNDGYDEASLTSLSTADYSCVAPLVKEVTRRLGPEKIRLGVSSLRAYGLGEDVLDDMATMGATGLTFAPEAGTQRMRDVVNKNVTEEQLMETADRVFSRGWRRMKLYFMIGLPTEEDEDVRGIAETGARAAAVGRRRLSGMKPTVVVSVSTHVPKPHTPFQWAAMDPLADIERKQRLLQDTARGGGIDLKMHDAKGSLLEGVFARGDRRVGDVLERAFRLGCRFDSWDEHLRLDLWQQAFQEEGVDPGRYLGTIPVDARLPWDHLDVGLEDGFLLAEYRKSLASRLSPPCGKPVGAFIHHTNLTDARADGRRLVCYDCGVACDLDQMRAERLDYLASMGAEKAVEPRPKPAKSHSAKPRPAAQPAPGTKPPVTYRYRLSFAKEGPAVYLGHLDLNRHMPRILRRAGVSVAYSLGFHPHPRITFAPALPLGVTSLEEWMDLVLAVPEEAELLPARLNAASPAGIRFLAARRMEEGERALSRVVALSDSLVCGAKGTLDVAAVVAAAADPSAPRTCVRKTPKGERVIDAMTYVRAVSPARPEDLTGAGLLGELDAVQVRLRMTGQGAIRPEQAVQALGGGEGPWRTVRLALHAEAADGSALSLREKLPNDPRPEPAVVTTAMVS